MTCCKAGSRYKWTELFGASGAYWDIGILKGLMTFFVGKFRS